jgi:hypothetical protein
VKRRSRFREITGHDAAKFARGLIAAPNSGAVRRGRQAKKKNLCIMWNST